MEVINYVGVPEAAKILGVRKETVRTWIEKGYLQATRFGRGRYMIPSEVLEKTTVFPLRPLELMT